MERLSTCSDDFYVNLNLNSEMEMPTGREPVLHFFERLQKRYPAMRNFYCRDRGDHVLEEDKERGHYRWASVERKRVCAGSVNPSSYADAIEMHRFLLEQAPYALTVSPLDVESLNLMVGFDFSYRGDHTSIVGEALGLAPAFEGLLELPGARPVSYEPAIQVALDEDCRVQCRLSIEPRTTAYHLRTGEFPEEQISVYVTARRYGSLDPGETFDEVLDSLSAVCTDVLDSFVCDQVLLPLQQAIAMK